MNNQRNYQVLLIEDNPADAKLVELHLEESKTRFQIFKAETLIEGLEIANKEDIDITLLDLTLPDSSGFKTVNTYIENCPEIPLIVFTGLNNEIVGSQSVRAGAQDYLVKGQFDYTLLNRIIRYAIQRFESKRQLAENARQLQIAEIRYEQAQELAHFGQWEIDLVSNQMKWSAEVFRIFGFKPGNITPSLDLYLEYVHYDDKEDVEAFFDQCIRDGKSRKIEHRILVNGKTIKHVIVQGRVFHDQKAEETLLIGTIQDISDRKHSEDLLLEKALEDRIHHDKQKALESFDFEFRTPLSSINHYLYLLSKGSLSKEKKDHLQNLGRALDDLTLTVNNLFNFSVLYNKEQEINRDTLVLPDFFQRVEKMLPFHRQDTNCSFKLDYKEKESIEIISDPNKLSHILFNLLHFTIDLTACQGKTALIPRVLSKGKKLEVKILSEWDSRAKLHNQHVFDWLQKGYWKRFSGEEDQIQQKIQVAALLIDRLGGTLSLTFDPKKFLQAEFTIDIEQVDSTGQEESRIDEPMYILLVEDNFLNLSSTRHLLESESNHIRVDVAENGLVAFEKHGAYDYDLILMDLQMPVMDGFESAERIREKDAKTPIIGLSASSSKEEAKKCKEAGMNDFILKPFKPDELMRCIQKQLESRASDLPVNN